MFLGVYVCVCVRVRVHACAWGGGDIGEGRITVYTITKILCICVVWAPYLAIVCCIGGKA